MLVVLFSLGKFEDSPKNPQLRKAFKCDICQASFRHYGSFKSQPRTHCGKKVIQVWNFQEPSKGQEWRNYSSVTFSGKLQCVWNFEVSVNNPQWRKTFNCDLCQEWCFSDAGYLKTHLRSHSGEPKTMHVWYMSDRLRCVWNFEDTRTCVRIHSGEKTFKCDIRRQSSVSLELWRVT